MSDWSAIVDALEAEVREALPDVPAGRQGFEWGVRDAGSLTDPELPHVFAHGLTEDVLLLEHLQEQTTVELQLSVWTRGETEDAIAARADLLRDRIRANRTLGGLVDHAHFFSRGIREFKHPHPDGLFVLVRTVKVV